MKDRIAEAAIWESEDSTAVVVEEVVGMVGGLDCGVEIGRIGGAEVAINDKFGEREDLGKEERE